MAQYTFLVQIPGEPAMEYVANVDPTIPLMDNFVRVVRASEGTPEEIPVSKKDESGRETDILWTFAYGDTEEEGMEELAEHLSLAAQGVFEGAEILVSDQTDVA